MTSQTLHCLAVARISSASHKNVVFLALIVFFSFSFLMHFKVKLPWPDSDIRVRHEPIKMRGTASHFHVPHPYFTCQVSACYCLYTLACLFLAQLDFICLCVKHYKTLLINWFNFMLPNNLLLRCIAKITASWSDVPETSIMH